MNERVRRVKEDQGGFTLIELMIVIIILGILAGVVIFSVRGVQDTGAAAACKTDLRSVETAVEAYAANHGGADAPDLVPSLITAPDQFLRWDIGFGASPTTQSWTHQGGAAGNWTITYYGPGGGAPTPPTGYAVGDVQATGACTG